MEYVQCTDTTPAFNSIACCHILGKFSTFCFLTGVNPIHFGLRSSHQEGLLEGDFAESVQGFVIAGPAGAGGMLHIDPGYGRLFDLGDWFDEFGVCFVVVQNLRYTFGTEIITEISNAFDLRNAV